MTLGSENNKAASVAFAVKRLEVLEVTSVANWLEMHLKTGRGKLKDFLTHKSSNKVVKVCPGRRFSADRERLDNSG